jgi:hypothetical protein
VRVAGAIRELRKRMLHRGDRDVCSPDGRLTEHTQIRSSDPIFKAQ